MRSQAIVISAYIAALVFIATLIALYVVVYPRTTTKVFEYKQFDVVRIIRSKTYWNACELAETIASISGADTVKVNITIINILDNRVIDSMNCSREIVNVDRERLTYYSYHFTRLSRTGVMYVYDIEVGIR